MNQKEITLLFALLILIRGEQVGKEKAEAEIKLLREVLE